MSNTKPDAAAKTEETEKVKLAKPHTHAGKDYEAGAELIVGKSTAAWLRNAGVVETAQTAAPAVAADKT
ncbi:DUF7210 family protein [Comamonas fluminis]|uniref:DUF7210 family protein n=1 Tax=Comamonas fluminis TaxID=2796366 RepID=UPI001C45EBE8|nr:hypothetical protein [Comamonas fluminis]